MAKTTKSAKSVKGKATKVTKIKDLKAPSGKVKGGMTAIPSVGGVSAPAKSIIPDP